MAEINQPKPPTWFWIAATLGLLWCLMGVTAYLMQAYGMGPGLDSEMTPAQRTLDASMPSWVMGAYAIAVFSGAIGCVGLLLRKRWAKLLLYASLAAVLVQQFWVFVLSDAMTLLGQSAAVLPTFVILVAIALAWFATHSARSGWIS